MARTRIPVYHLNCACGIWWSTALLPDEEALPPLNSCARCVSDRRNLTYCAVCGGVIMRDAMHTALGGLCVTCYGNGDGGITHDDYPRNTLNERRALIQDERATILSFNIKRRCQCNYCSGQRRRPA